ncbi:MAG: cyclase family protein [Syntrophobacteraceae bacterium]
MGRIIDLSIAIEAGLPSDPPQMIPEIEYWDHRRGAEHMKTFFPGAEEEDLPSGLGWAIEFVRLSTHSGTHLDAPWHYHPTANREAARTIDQIPLEWCFSDGVVLNFSDKPDGYLVTPSDLESALAGVGYGLKPFDIVLVRTGADKHWGSARYLVSGCGMGRDATLWLLDRGVKVVGTDAWSWDRPLPYIAKEFRDTGNSRLIWEGHFAGIEKEYCHMEKLTNLDKLPPHGFQIACFPIKIHKASAGWVRAVAILP